MSNGSVPETPTTATEVAVRENLLRFAGRTAVAKDGEPQRVFHGTSSRFDAFDIKRLGWNVDNPTTSLGFFFTDKRDDAWRWAKRRGHKAPPEASPQILEVFLAIENPRVVSYDKFDYMLRRARASTIEKFKRDTIAAGHDGLKIEYLNPDGQPETWWVAFQPGQIKSATHNFGTFDPADPSMTDRAARERAAANEDVECAEALRKAKAARP